MSKITDEFCRNICKEIRFTGCHTAVSQEIRDHIADHMDVLLHEGFSREEAEQEAVAAMGDPEEIGKELNRFHRPWLGWALRFTYAAIVILGVWLCFSLLTFTGNLIRSSFQEPFQLSENETIVSEVSVNEQLELETRTVTITKVILTTTAEEKSDLYVLYKYKNKNPFRSGWYTDPLFQCVSDSGEQLSNYTSFYSGASKTAIQNVENFPLDSEYVTLVYDRYNRYWETKIPLKGGKNDVQNS